MYIIGAKIKTESRRLQQQILDAPKEDGVMQKIVRTDRRRLLVGYSEVSARKDITETRESVGLRKHIRKAH